MKSIQKQLLVEKNIDETWSFFDSKNNQIEELISNLFKENVDNVEIIKVEENIVNTEFNLDIKIGKKILKSKSKIIHYRNEPFWKEIHLRMNLDEKNYADLKIELTLFEGDKDKTLVKFMSNYEISNLIWKAKLLAFKSQINNWIQEKLDDVKTTIEKM